MDARRRLLLTGALAAALLLGGGILRAIRPSVSNPDASRGASPQPPQQSDPVPAPAGTAPATATAASSWDEARVKDVIREVLQKRRDLLQGRRSVGGSRFDIEQDMRVREARLLALGYPEWAEKAARPIALDPTADLADRSWGIAVLSFVAKGGSASAQETLLILARDANEEIAEAALAGVAESDRDGRHKSLLWACARKGSGTAFSYLQCTADPQTVAELRTYKAGAPGYSEAAEALRKLEALSSPGATAELEGILSGRPSSVNDAYYWALEAFPRKDPARFREVARLELDKAHERALAWWNKNALVINQPSFEGMFTRKANLQTQVDLEYYDDLLVAFFEAGGTTTELERKRLRTFGYGCDPKERLAELRSE